MSWTVRSTVWPGATLVGNATGAGALPDGPICWPWLKTREYGVVHVQEPTFFSCQVLTMVAPGETIVPSGTVTSRTNCALSQTGEAFTGGLFVAGGATLKITTAVPVPVGEGVRDGEGENVVDGAATADCVHCAWRACAEAVRAIFGVSTAGTLPGALQAANTENTAINTEMRTVA
jgi:hypothetical protein